MAEKIYSEPKAVLIFNCRKTLVLVASSVNEAAKISGLKPGNYKGLRGHIDFQWYVLFQIYRQ